MRKRVVLFLLVVVGSVAGASTYVGFQIARARGSSPPPGVRVVEGASLASVQSPAAALRVVKATAIDAKGGPQLLFRNAIPDKTFGRLAVAPVAKPNATRALAGLSCDRVYFAAGRGLCLTATGAFASSYVAKIFDARFRVVKEIRLQGIPSRARMTADGRLGAMTVFVNGDSYAPGNFSTRTTLDDMRTGRTLGDLERFTVTRNGKRFHNRNFNFWGVTFAHDDDRFYATLGSGADTYLVRGSVKARTMQVIHTHVECPSLSPDGTRIVFKRSLNSHQSWRLYVLDLRTMREKPLAETGSVDDQAEWLDDRRVLYWRGTDIWVVPADGSGSPRKLVSEASSPVVIPAS
jgi:hypothetical protein